MVCTHSTEGISSKRCVSRGCWWMWRVIKISREENGRGKGRGAAGHCKADKDKLKILETEASVLAVRLTTCSGLAIYIRGNYLS